MLIHWIWLAERPGINDRQKMLLLESFGDAEDVFFAEKEDILGLESITPRGKESLFDKDLSQAEEICRQCDEKGICICTLRDEEYPERLKNIIDPPLVLYYKGRIPDMEDVPVVAAVGTRKSSVYGNQVAMRMGYQITACGGVLVSGAAEGIDGYAMRGGLMAGGTVVGILGCGADVVYPKKNKDLFGDMERYGCLISEFPPETPPYGWNFPKRNRIISGLCNGVVVIEAPERSGSLSTMRHAADQGRDVFVVPGNVDMPTFAGSNALLRDGATAVRDGWDVVSEYEQMYPGKVHPMALDNQPEILIPEREHTAKVAQSPRTPAAKSNSDKKNKKKPIDNGEKQPYSDVKEILPTLTDDQRSIVELLTCERLVDDIVAETGLSAAKVSSAITMLQIKGIIKQLPGKRIVLK